MVIPLLVSKTEFGRVPEQYSGEERRRGLGSRHQMNALLLGVVVIGVGLRLWPYIANTSPRLD